MWIEIPGNFTDNYSVYPSKVYYYNDDEEKVIVRENEESPYLMIPLSGLPLTHYYLNKPNSGQIELTVFGKDNNYMFLNNSSNYIFLYYASNYFIHDGERGSESNNEWYQEPVTGYFKDVDNNDQYFGDTNFIYKVDNTGYSPSGDYRRYTTSGQTEAYGTVTISSIFNLNIPTLSSETLYGVYSDGNGNSRIFGDSIISYTYDNGTAYGNIKNYDSSLSGYPVNSFYRKGNVSSSNNYLIHKINDNKYIIGTSGVSPWWEGNGIPSSNLSSVVFHSNEGSEEPDLTLTWQGYSSFMNNYLRIYASSLENTYKESYTTDILIADPWRWLK